MEPNNFARLPSNGAITNNLASNPSQSPIAAPAPLRPAAAAMNKAEMYEDEKRRIMSSCFARKDEKGRLMQSYITHMRVIEDAAYPSSPPPPDSNPQYKKARVILVAVKNTGRVLMHKARENDDLTFQIGKSWPLEDLESIESFSNASPQTPEERERAAWAGSSGFVIAMGKPYYWQANSPKEKEFFIGSLVKIYKKYTSGNTPKLIGFSSLEQEAILMGTPSSGNRSASQQHSQSTPAPPASPTRPDDLRPPQARRPSTPRSEQDKPKLSGRITNPGISPTDIPQSANMAGMNSMITPATPVYGSTTGDITPRPSSQGSGVRGPRSQSPSIASTTPILSSPRRPSSPRTQVTDGKVERSTEPPNLPPFAPRINGSAPVPMPRQTSSRGISPEPVTTAASQSFTPESQPVETVPQSPPTRRRPPLQDGGTSATPRSFTTESPASSVGGLTISKSPPQYNDKAQESTASRNVSGASIPTPPPRHEDRQGDDANLRAKAGPSPEPTVASPTPEEERQYRPGLGPMIGKRPSNDVASKFRKAATAYGAFKPRAGGAGDRLLRKPTDEPDGVTGVVPAPSSASRETGEELVQSPLPIDSVSKESPLPTAIDEDLPRPSSKSGPAEKEKEIESVIPKNQTPAEVQGQEEVLPNQRIQRPPPLKSASRNLAKRRSNLYAKSLSILDIDSRVLEGKEAGYESVLAEFGWDQDSMRPKKVDAFETDLRREIGRLEAGGWLGHDDQKDERMAAVEVALDKAIAECDEMDGLLTLYGVELGSLNEDISYVQAQSQGLQVQTANQKLLQTELQRLVDTISMGSTQMEPLRRQSLAKPESLESIESCLVLLYKALITIDPALLRSRSTINSVSGFGDGNFANMRALQEKKGLYMEEAMRFLERLRNYVDPTFGAAFMKTTEMINRTSTPSKGSLSVSAHDAGRNELWQYSPMMLFAKDLDQNTWQEIIRVYRGRARPVYEAEFKDNFMSWKKAARKPTGDEQEALFTTQAAESEGLTSTARKLTVKRSATLARGLRSSNLEKRPGLQKNQEGGLFAFEAFAGALEEMIPLVSTEQNFVAEFFHATSFKTMDFVEAVTSARPSERGGYDLKSPRIMEPDRAMALKVLEAMEDIFGSWPNDMQALVDWAVKSDHFQAIGILCALERKRLDLEETNQEFLAKTLQKLHDRLSALLTRFVDDQIRAIEETKVKIKKRRGVIAFMKVFPNFSALVEATLPRANGPEKLEIRQQVDSGYSKINKAMWDSLKVIAKDSPSAGLNGFTPGFAGANLGRGGDAEDKEALNYHILLIENMYHYYSEVEEHGDAVLGEWRGKAMLEMSEHQEAYVNAVIRRPLGQLLDYVEGLENILSSLGRESPTSVPNTHANYKGQIFKRLMASHDAREIRKGVDALRKRIEKHFGEADDATISQKLVNQILGECERHYNDALERTARLAKDVYESEIEVGFSKADISQAFRR